MSSAATITAGSFTIIRRELQAAGYQFEPPLMAVVERVIHSTADFEFAARLRFSPDALDAGIAALRAGCAIITDVQMVRVGISERRLAAFGGTAHCFIADPAVQAQASASGETRSAVAMRHAAASGLLAGNIVAIGNAPTALYEVIRQIEAGVRPALVIGVPVGFVNTAESKLACMQLSSVPWIVTVGRKGGSTVAVAIVNALLRLAAGAPAIETD